MRALLPGCGIAVCILSCGLAACSAGIAGIGLNFTASTFQVDSSYIPPDCNGAIGPSNFVEFINGRIAVYDKTSAQLVESVDALTFWSQAGVNIPGTWDTADPRIIYDSASRRWFASQIDYDTLNGANTNHFLLAVSATSDPTGTWQGVTIPSDPTGVNNSDFDTLGLDESGVYIAGDVFSPGGAPIGSILVSIPKTNLLISPPTATNGTIFANMSYSSHGDILQPAICFDRTARGSVLAAGDLGYDEQPHSDLLASTVLNAAGPGSATLPAPTTITVPDYYIPPLPYQPDSLANTDYVDDGDARFSASVCAVRGVLYAVQSTTAGGYAAIAWYRINPTNYTLLESGTITAEPLDLFFPSIAANTNGTVVICCNGSSLSNYVSAYAYVGATVAGVTTFNAPMLLKAGVANYHLDDGAGVNRWGDYSSTTVDPSDPTVFWTIQEYPSGPAVWSTQIAQIWTALPRLAISISGTNRIISWPAYAAAFQLQSTTNLLATNSWSPVTQTLTTNISQISVTVPAAASRQFFRLTQTN